MSDRATVTPAATVLLIDLSGLVHAFWHVSSTNPDPDATAKQAVAKVHALASRYTHAAVCADSGRSFRRDIDPTYKANRPELDAPIKHQLRLAQDMLTEDGFALWKADGFEADDIIASASMKAIEAGHQVCIASNDKDLMQLVCEDVTILSPMTGNTYDAAGVVTKFGVGPAQMRDYLTLVGDSSDNVKGVQGIGPKKAADLLQRFQRLDVLMEQAGTKDREAIGLTPAIYAAIKDSTAVINRARELVTLRTDAPVPFDDIFKDRVSTRGQDTMTDTLESAETAVATRLEAPTGDVKPGTDVAQPSAAAETALVRAEVVEANGDWSRGLEPRTLGDARVVSKWFMESRLFSQFGSPQAVLSVILAGRELGLGAMASLRGFHVVEGRPCIAADLLRGLVLASGKAEYFTCTERTAESATWITKRVGSPHEMSVTYTMDDAKAAKLTRPGSGWEKHPADMLAKSASTKLCRLAYADLSFGLYSPVEMGGDEL